MGSWACYKCGHRRADQRVRCPHCGAFCSFVQSALEPPPPSVYALPDRAGDGASTSAPFAYDESSSEIDVDEDEDEDEDDAFEGDLAEPVAIDDVELADDDRIVTGLDTLDEVLGGGFPGVGASYMVQGSPGVGKSTLLLEMLYALGQRGCKTGYVSNEMQPELIATYAGPKRLNLAKRYPVKKAYRPEVFAAMDVDQIIATADARGYGVVVIDSLSACRSPRSSGPMGGASQMTYACERLVERIQRKPGSRFADADPLTVVSIVHETKDGSQAGPNAVKHWFDASLALDHVDGTTLDPLDDQTDPSGFVRLRSPGKNRWASSQVKVYFEMTKRGLRPFDPEAKPKIAKKPRVDRSVRLAG